jgi:hypothetical protein
MSLLDRKDRKLRRAARKADRKARQEIAATEGPLFLQLLRNPFPYKHPKQGPYKENKNK